ncbi:MAG: chorismate mutase [Acidobacteria bacterium]|nr:chorismate mutase [Acidobacteriota bacterium]
MTIEEARAALGACRLEIDDVDRRLVALLNERTRVVERVGDIKQQVALPVYDPKREEQVFQNIAAANQGPLPDAAIKRVFERIIDEMRTLERTRMEGK